MKPVLTIVVPVFNEESCIDQLWSRLLGLQNTLSKFQFEIIFVNDGSTDNTMVFLRQLVATYLNVQVIYFSRNFGHQRAVTAGLDHSNGDIVVVIDADLQDPPELIQEMVTAYEAGNDIVYAKRRMRKGESWFKLVTASLFYRMLNSVSDINISIDSGDFRLMSRSVVNELTKMKETDRFIRGMVNWLGFRSTYVLYDRDARYAGKTKYPLKKMISFAIDGMLSFSNVPLRFASWLGVFTSFTSLVYGLYVVYIKFQGYTVPGYASIMVTMLFLGGVQLLSVGVLGEYVGRIFIQNKQRPLYVIQDHLNAPRKND